MKQRTYPLSPPSGVPYSPPAVSNIEQCPGQPKEDTTFAYRATCRQIGLRIAIALASLSIDRQKPAPLVALLRARADPVRLSGLGCLAGVGQTADDGL
jgi:hypothetical protein